MYLYTIIYIQVSYGNLYIVYRKAAPSKPLFIAKQFHRKLHLSKAHVRCRLVTEQNRPLTRQNDPLTVQTAHSKQLM